jgi:energy-converting hydrogenase Eha subunit B
MATYYGIQEDSDGNVLLPVPNGICGIERGTSATQSYVKGNLVYVGNRLCQVNSAITSGDALTIGGNISYTSMANQVHNINVFVNNNREFVFTDHTGADCELNFSQIYDLCTGTSYNVSSVSGYHNFTTANFMYRIGNANGHLVSGDQGQGWFAGSADFSDSYNSSTGVLTVSYRAYLMTPNSGPMHGSLTSVHAYLITKTSGIRPLSNP